MGGDRRPHLRVEQVEPGEDEQYRYDRLLLTLQFIYGYRGIPNILVSQQMMADLREAVTGTIGTSITNWINTGDQGHLDRSITQLNTILECTRGWPVSKEKSLYSAARTVKAATQRFEQRASELAEAIESSKGELKAYVDDQEVRFDQRENERLERFNQLEAKLTQIDQVVGQYSTKADEIDKRIDSVMTTQQNNFSTAETQRQKDNKDNIAKQQQEFAAELDKAVAASGRKLEVQESTSQDIVSRIKELETQARNATTSAAGARTSKDYKVYAEEQRIEADNLRKWAVVLFVVAFVAGASGWIVTEFRQDFAWSTAALKVTLTFSLIAAAAYLVTESSNHREKEASAKSAQLRLEALEPFISNLETPDIRVLRMAAAQDLFIVKDRNRLELAEVEVASPDDEM